MKFFLGLATLAAAGPIIYNNGYPNNQYGSNYRPNTYQPAGYNPAGYNPAGYNPTGYNPTGYNPTGYNPSGYNPTGNNPTGYNQNGYNPNCNTYLQNGQTQPCWQQRQCNSVRTDGTPISCQLQNTSRYQTKVCVRNFCRCIDAYTGLSRPNNYCGITTSD